MSPNTGGGFIILTYLSKIVNTYFMSDIVKFENSKAMRVF